LTWFQPLRLELSKDLESLIDSLRFDSCFHLFLFINFWIIFFFEFIQFQAGCFFVMCPIEYVAGRVTLRVQELNVSLETKTKDNVFVTVKVSVQYQVIFLV
jgi:regulator of protease activity HflC (stomatin/prohibitin superfamily)